MSKKLDTFESYPLIKCHMSPIWTYIRNTMGFWGVVWLRCA